jgi:hypothetical protein
VIVNDKYAHEHLAVILVLSKSQKNTVNRVVFSPGIVEDLPRYHEDLALMGEHTFRAAPAQPLKEIEQFRFDHGSDPLWRGILSLNWPPAFQHLEAVPEAIPYIEAERNV